MQRFIIRVHLYEAHNTRLFSELNLLMFPLCCGLGTGGGNKRTRAPNKSHIFGAGMGQIITRWNILLMLRGYFLYELKGESHPRGFVPTAEAGLALCIIHISISSWWSCAMSVCSPSRGADGRVCERLCKGVGNDWKRPLRQREKESVSTVNYSSTQRCGFRVNDYFSTTQEEGITFTASGLWCFPPVTAPAPQTLHSCVTPPDAGEKW